MRTITTRRVKTARELHLLERRAAAAGEPVHIAYAADIHGELSALQRMSELVSSLRCSKTLDLAVAVGDNVEGAGDVELFFAVWKELSATFDYASLGDHEFDIHDKSDLREGARLLEELIKSHSLSNNDLLKARRKLILQRSAAQENESLLGQALNKTSIPVVCSNLSFVPGTLLYSLYNAQRIGPAALTTIKKRHFLILGVVNPDLQLCFDYHKSQGWNDSISLESRHPRGIILAQIALFMRLYPQVEFTTIVLSHCGLVFDERELAHPAIDLIIGAHTHNELHRVVEFENGACTHILHSGQNGQNLGFITLLPGSGGSEISVEHTLIDTNIAVCGETSDTLLESVTLEGRTLGHSAKALSLEGKSKRSTELMRFLCDAVAAAVRSDLALLVPGMVRAGLPQGKITDYDLRRVLPWNDFLLTVILTGKEIEALIQAALRRSLTQQVERPLLLHFSGLKYAVNDAAELESVFINYCGVWHALVTAREYSLACTEFVAYGLGGDFPLTKFVEANGTKVSNTGMRIRDAVRQILEKGSTQDLLDNDRIAVNAKAPLIYNDSSVVY